MYTDNLSFINKEELNERHLRFLHIHLPILWIMRIKIYLRLAKDCLNAY